MRNTAYLSLIFILFSTVSSVAFGSTLEGKLERFGEYGITPASSVTVTLCFLKNGEELKRVISDSEGIYYFDNVNEGEYILRVWIEDYNKEKALNYKIHVPNNQDIEIDTKLTHFLSFGKPKKNYLFKTKDTIHRIRASGIYHSIPDHVSLWIAFSRYNHLYFSNNSVILHENGTWETAEILDYPNDNDITQINVVMITEEESKKLQKKVSDWNKFPIISDIPENSYIIIKSRKIRIE